MGTGTGMGMFSKKLTAPAALPSLHFTHQGVAWAWAWACALVLGWECAWDGNVQQEINRPCCTSLSSFYAPGGGMGMGMGMCTGTGMGMCMGWECLARI